MSSGAPAFLVVIPTYKRPGPLRMAIQSALSQTNILKQIVVADDCPDGSAAEVVRDYPEVIYLKNLKPSGGWPGRVRNFAFEACCKMGIHADYVHFLDDDDTVPEGHYELVNEAFDRHPRIGVIFGLLRPFCVFSEDPVRREQQELQLRHIRKWRIEVSRFPWFYHAIGSALKRPAVAQWLYCQHALFGAEMFLCSGGIIRHKHVLALGGFPDIRITQDYFFYSNAIRKFGCHFVGRETAGYGVGDTGAIWNPLNLDGAGKVAHTYEWMQELKTRQRDIRTDLGFLQYYTRKAAYRAGHVTLSQLIFPILHRRGYFMDMYCMINPNCSKQKPASLDECVPNLPHNSLSHAVTSIHSAPCPRRHDHA